MKVMLQNTCIFWKVHFAPFQGTTNWADTSAPFSLLRVLNCSWHSHRKTIHWAPMIGKICGLKPIRIGPTLDNKQFWHACQYALVGCATNLASDRIEKTFKWSCFAWRADLCHPLCVRTNQKAPKLAMRERKSETKEGKRDVTRTQNANGSNRNLC